MFSPFFLFFFFGGGEDCFRHKSLGEGEYTFMKKVPDCHRMSADASAEALARISLVGSTLPA